MNSRSHLWQYISLLRAQTNLYIVLPQCLNLLIRSIYM